MQAFAMTSDEKEDDEEKEYEEEQIDGSPASPLLSEATERRAQKQWRTLERMVHKEGPVFAQCCFSPALFFACSHICCLGVCFFYPTFVSKVHIFICTYITFSFKFC